MKYVAIFISTVVLIYAGQIKVPTSFSASFTQKITNAKKKVIKYSGKVLLNSSGSLKWSYRKPSKKEVCSNGKSFTIVDHDLEQVSFHKLERALDLTSILKKAKYHKDSLYVAKYQEVLYTFSLDKKGRIDQIAYKDTLDNVVNIHFQNMRYSNKPNLNSRMTCPYPQAYDIIRG
ncbi:MAG: hypothetical protein HF962_02410 [Sulfurovum sp.]|nr:hypothetical protein [Sulfurovum sp.]